MRQVCLAFGYYYFNPLLLIQVCLTFGYYYFSPLLLYLSMVNILIVDVLIYLFFLIWHVFHNHSWV